jgi:hypothetical protein
MGSHPRVRQHQTFNKFKSAIFKLYPSLESECKWTIADMDKLVREHLWMGILNISDLGNYYQVFYTITQFLLIKNWISEAEQSRAPTRGFQLDLWYQISRRLKIKLPNHDPDNFYPLFEINKAEKHVLHGISQNSFLQPSVILTTPPTQLVSPPYVKVKDLSMLFKQMAQSSLKVLTPQKSMTNRASSSTNAQAMTMLDLLSCIFCSQSGHFIAQCLICVDYITNEKCKRNILYFPMDNLHHTAFPVSLSKTVSMNGISIILLNPHPLLWCMKLTQWQCQVKPVLLPTWSQHHWLMHLR